MKCYTYKKNVVLNIKLCKGETQGLVLLALPMRKIHSISKGVIFYYSCRTKVGNLHN